MNILRKQFLSHVGQTSPSPMLVEVERAEGVYFYTPEGKRYYDLIAGVSVSNVGHANPAVVKAVQEQAANYMHVMVYGELVETPQVNRKKQGYLQKNGLLKICIVPDAEIHIYVSLTTIVPLLIFFAKLAVINMNLKVKQAHSIIK